MEVNFKEDSVSKVKFLFWICIKIALYLKKEINCFQILRSNELFILRDKNIFQAK